MELCHSPANHLMREHQYYSFIHYSIEGNDIPFGRFKVQQILLLATHTMSACYENRGVLNVVPL